ncbi:NUDIX domain-containing protein [Myroides sp. M-43]|uniref:NUDIX hydrolase n=1 Tax=Myroides oncorhynchi TaxID=2893756 RepID=UPI001E2CF6E6|nr:NUDIX domain-containing protein [Myroides oncorhynchi]MCC9041397.1 NUDIX domain-containing protein [Myroides oncorhynchi]
MHKPTILYLASALITDSSNRLLTVRKKDSSYYMMAGGKIEKGELPEQTLIRELNEELNLTITSKDFILLGTHSTTAVNEPNTIVTAHIYHVIVSSVNLQPAAEIAEVKWLTKDTYQNTKLAHLLEEFSIPKWLAFD